MKLFDRWIRRRTEMLVKNSWWRVEAIARALCERTTLKGDEIRDVLGKAVEKRIRLSSLDSTATRVRRKLNIETSRK